VVCTGSEKTGGKIEKGSKNDRKIKEKWAKNERMRKLEMV